jgi:hypothetical protein
MVQNSSMWLTSGPAKTSSTDVAEYLIRQAEIAAGCVRRFRHGIDHTDPDATNTDFGAVACG